MEWMLMPLKRYADFSGRSRRMEYWMWVVFQALIAIAFLVVLLAVGGAALMSGDPAQMVAVGGIVILLYLLWALLGLIFFIPNLAVTVRRLHDTNRSGWWVLAPWGPYLLMIFASAAIVGTTSKPDETTLGMMGLVMIVLGLAALVLGLVVLVFLFLEGTKGPNQYGPDPKSPTPAGVFS
jgi:uncharacterized membrane protein YhaH (DUF805 family)